MKVLLFDIDGTLIHSKGAGRSSFVDALRAGFGVQADERKVAFAGRTDPLIARDFFLLHNIKLSTRNFHVFFENYLPCLQRNMFAAEGHVNPGVREILEICRNGNGTGRRFVAGLLTGNIEAGAKIKLERFDLWQYFELGAFASDHEERDEIARIAHERAQQRFGGKLKPEDILVIGDTPRDIQCGKFIGARTVAVATGPHSVRELEACKPSLTLQDLSRVKEFLDWAGRD